VDAPFERPDVGGADECTGPIEPLGLVQLGEQQLVELVEHAGVVRQSLTSR
jgi:hypothetical protein